MPIHLKKEFCAFTEGSMKHRRVKHYGYEFLYGINNVDIDTPLKHGIPSECDKVIEKLLVRGHIKVKPDQLTVNQYEPGQGECISAYC